MIKLSCFKAYDIRGKVPSELNLDLAYKIGKAYAKYLGSKKVVIGYDIRKSSIELSEALADGLSDSGTDVINLGLCGTEMIYFATPYLETDGGIMITASHNPPEYNGLKFVRKGAIPMGYESGLSELEKMITQNDIDIGKVKKGEVKTINIMAEFITSLNKFYEADKIKNYKVVVNSGNGCVGPALDKLEPKLPIKMVKIFHEPDSNFPNGVPNPLIPKNRTPTINAIKEHKADLGVAWDGDYDRCFFFDENGNFIEGYYIVGLLAKSILYSYPEEKIVHDPRLIWNTIDIVNKSKGEAVVSKSGHAFIKQKMREVNAIYGGEMSAHHYFRDNAYSDSGLIPFLLILQLMSDENKKLSELVSEMIDKYPCSGEINSRLENPGEKLERLKEFYSDGTLNTLDGVSIEYKDWRFNVRMSNTEPLIRLNVESKNDIDLMKNKTEEILELIRN
ncbi:phosphomannomutase [Bacteroidota bacterium]